MKIEEIANHRNGVGGAPFYAVTFKNSKSNMLAIVFEEPGTVAVFDLDLLGEGVIAFTENSWRGDVFEDDLRKAIERHHVYQK